MIVFLAIFAILTSPSKTSTGISTPQHQPPSPQNLESSLLKEKPKLPSHTKDGKPIDPHTLDYAAELQNAMKNYDNEIEGSASQIIESGNKLAQAYITAGFYEEGIKVCEQVLSVVETEHGSISSEAILPLKLISKASSEVGKFREAVEYWTFLENIMIELYGATHPETLGSLMSLVGIYIHTGNVDSALTKLQQYIQYLQTEYNTYKSEYDSIQGQPDMLSKEYDVAHKLINTLSALGEMYYGCSMAWDRVEADPEGVAKLKRLRDEQQKLLEKEDEYGEIDEDASIKDVETVESEPYTPYEIYRNQEHYRREVIYYRQQVVDLIDRYRQQRTDRLKLETSSSNVNPYTAGIVPIDSRAKLAQSLQQYAYLRYQHGTVDDDTLKLFHQVVNISADLAHDTNPSFPSHSQSTTTSNPSTFPSLQPASEPSLLQYPVHKDVAISLNNLGSVYLDVNDLNQAEYYIRQALLIREELLNQNMKTQSRDEKTQSEIDLAMCKGNLGRVLQKREQWNEAEIELKEGIDILENLLKGAKKEENKSKILPFLERLQYQIHQGIEMRAIKETELVEEIENE